MDLYRVAQIAFVKRFSPESTSVCYDLHQNFKGVWRNGSWIERWKLSPCEVSKSYVYSEFFCEMSSSYCTYHNSSRALKTHELTTATFAKVFLSSYISLHEYTAILTVLRMLGYHLVPDESQIVPDANLVPRAHMSFGQRQDTWALGTRLRCRPRFLAMWGA